MSLRISSLALAAFALLVACGPEAGALPGDAVECALGPGAQLSPDCTLEREEAGGRDEVRIVLHHPGGGFRRFRLDPETLDITAADGAERVSGQSFESAHLAFTIGGDAYRIPLPLITDEP